ncbi:hypothetical protein M3Y98_00599500 [Aphelenchoides besseyi]|nr:hypothetical protein M3Y98_00599500 [Aphelenchoides besseyi]
MTSSKQRDKGGGRWILVLLSILSISFLVDLVDAQNVSDPSKILNDDHRVRYMQFYHLDSECKFRRFMINDDGRFNDQDLEIVEFKNAKGDKTDECDPKKHNFFQQFEGQYIMSLSSTSSGYRLWRIGVQYDGKVAPAQQPQSGEMDFANEEEKGAKINVANCFLDLETFIVCPLLVTNVAGQAPKILMKRSFILEDGSLITNSHNFGFFSINPQMLAQLHLDPLTGQLALTHMITGTQAYELELRHIYNSQEDDAVRVEMHARGIQLKAISSYSSWQYILTNPGYVYGPTPDPAENQNSTKRVFALFRQAIGQSDFRTLIGFNATIQTTTTEATTTEANEENTTKANEQNTTEANEENATEENTTESEATGPTYQMFEIYEAMDRLNSLSVPLLGENLTKKSVAAKIFINSTYPETGGHGTLSRQIITHVEQCDGLKKYRADCVAAVASVMLQEKIAVLLTVICTVIFIILLIFLLFFAVFCIKERRRRHRRKKRKNQRKTKKPASVPSSDPNKKGEAVEVEIDPTKAPITPAALPDQDEESEKDKKEEKGVGGYFAQQMRRLTKMEDDDEFEQPDAAAGGAKGIDETEQSNYVLAQDRFETPALPGASTGTAPAPGSTPTPGTAPAPGTLPGTMPATGTAPGTVPATQPATTGQAPGIGR